MLLSDVIFHAIHILKYLPAENRPNHFSHNVSDILHTKMLPHWHYHNDLNPLTHDYNITRDFTNWTHKRIRVSGRPTEGFPQSPSSPSQGHISLYSPDTPPSSMNIHPLRRCIRLLLQRHTPSFSPSSLPSASIHSVWGRNSLWWWSDRRPGTVYCLMTQSTGRILKEAEIWWVSDHSWRWRVLKKWLNGLAQSNIL